jgi:hypothetical protein
MKSSQNGWPLIWDSSTLDRSIIPGTNRGIELRAGAVRVVFDYLCSEFNRRVEGIDEDQRDDWGWAKPVRIPGSSEFSNHGSGTAVDLNATRHPWGSRGTFTATQVSELRTILGELGGIVRWGGDYTGKPDEMHFEINAPYEEVRNVAAIVSRGAFDPTKPVPAGGPLRLGQSGNRVKALQLRLNRDYPRYSRLEIDGIYGPATESVVREFQKRAGLAVDGIAGPDTLTRLGS